MATSSRATQLTIGSLQLPSAVILSPLERISDIGFRRLCWEQGAGFTWTEMIYASELVKPYAGIGGLAAARKAPRGGRGAALIDTHDEAVLTGVQLLIDRTTARDGYGVDLLRASLEQLEEGAATDRPEWQNIRAIDLNFGCPAAAISRRGAGPAQLRKRSKMRALFEVLSAWRKATPLKIGAVGAKIRLGNTLREQHYKVYLPVAEAAAESLDYLVVHARHGEQRSREPPNWDAIAEVKQAVHGAPLRIIANGDVRTPSDVVRVRAHTGCDGVMVGRAAMRNPWCLRALADAWNGPSKPAAFASDAANAMSEWPSLDELDRASQMNEAMSSGCAAAARFRRFRQENFSRIRIESARAASCTASAGNPSTRHSRPHPPQSARQPDWYDEWSKGATRRRHLEKLDDDEARGASGADGRPATRAADPSTAPRAEAPETSQTQDSRSSRARAPQEAPESGDSADPRPRKYRRLKRRRNQTETVSADGRVARMPGMVDEP